MNAIITDDSDAAWTRTEDAERVALAGGEPARVLVVELLAEIVRLHDVLADSAPRPWSPVARIGATRDIATIIGASAASVAVQRDDEHIRLAIRPARNNPGRVAYARLTTMGARMVARALLARADALAAIPEGVTATHDEVRRPGASGGRATP